MEYEIDNDTICFHSYPENYVKEVKSIRCSGYKNNTVRLNPIVSDVDKIMNWWNGDIRYIKITNTITGESFVRLLTDITVYMNAMVFTWSL